MSNSSELSSEDPNAVMMAELRARADTLERQLTDLQRHTETRLVRAELKAEAVRAGMIDLDGLRLVDLPSLKLNERGEVEGAAAVMQDLRKNKPWLFGTVGAVFLQPVQPAAGHAAQAEAGDGNDRCRIPRRPRRYSEASILITDVVSGRYL